MFCDIFSQTGYASHGRQLVNAIYKQNPTIHIECLKPQDWVRYVNTAEMNMINSEPFKNGHCVAIQLPPYWKLFLSDKPKSFTGYVIWEGINIPKYWCPILDDNRVTNVIVPSKHTYDAIFNTYKPKNPSKFKIISHGVDLKLFSPKKQ